jgi:uncharacterized protein YuzE
MATDKTKQERLEREEDRQDKGELDRETLQQRLKHHQDAIKNLQKEIKSLEKDEKEDKGDVKEESSAAKTKKQWEKIDTKELRRDTKKEQKEHEKDAIKDDQSKIKKLQKGKPSEKKKAETFYLKRDEQFDKARAAESVKIEMKKEGEVLEVDIEEAAQKFFGGKKRSNLKDSDFLFPAKRSFPIATPADVPDAVSNFGRMSGNMSYDEFKKKLVTFVKKKGPKFVAALPNTIKKEFDLADATQIAVFPDKYVDPKDVGTFYQDTRPINCDGYKIDEKLKEEVQQNKLKNPQLRSAQQRAEGLS